MKKGRKDLGFLLMGSLHQSGVPPPWYYPINFVSCLSVASGSMLRRCAQMC